MKFSLKTKGSKKKFFAGIATSVAMILAIGSFAMSESQSIVTDDGTGPFHVEGSTDYTYSNSVLTLHQGDFTVSTSGETAEQIVVDNGANITLSGVDIATDKGPALEIKAGTFNVKITLAENSENTLQSNKKMYAGLQKKSDENDGTLTIDGSGSLTATGGEGGAGIGGGGAIMFNSASNIIINDGKITANGGDGGAGIGGGLMGDGTGITINDGEVTVTGGGDAAGIGGGEMGNGKNIEINDGIVKAIAKSDDIGQSEAGIGGGNQGSGSNITIRGGVVTAEGGDSAAGIGGGGGGNGSDIHILGGIITATGGNKTDKVSSGAGIGGGGGDESTPAGTGSGNILNGNAVVFATSGGEDKDAIEGFDEDEGGSLTQGIIFTQQRAENDGWKSEMYGNVAISKNIEFPASLTVSKNQTLTVDSGATLSLLNGVKLQNEGILTESGNIDCSKGGMVTTLINYEAQGGSTSIESEYKTYRDSSGVRKYETLPSATKDGFTLGGWYTSAAGAGSLAAEDTLVDVNQHELYAKWTSNPEPTPTPEPAPDSSVDPDQGGSGASSKTSDPFMGGVALALLGVATTGAILTRKLR